MTARAGVRPAERSAIRARLTTAYRRLIVDNCDRLDLDHRVGIGQAADLDRRRGRRRRAEIPHPHVGVLGELLVVGDEGIGLDDVGESGAGGFETVLMFSPTCWIWARMSPLPTQFPRASRANCPATKIIFPVPLTVTTWVYLAWPSTMRT